MRVLAPRFAHAEPSTQPPIDVNQKFSVHGSVESLLNNSPKTPQKLYPKIQNSMSFGIATLGPIFQFQLS